MGSIYKRGNVYWIKYYKNGKLYRESSKSPKKMVAKRLLGRREGDIAQGKTPGIYFEKVFFDDLSEIFLRDYRINQKKSLQRAVNSVDHLSKAFEGKRVQEITTPAINIYVENRMAEGAKNATINRELAALKRMLNLGARQTPPLVERVPYIPLLKENNVRKGFFEHDEFHALREFLPEYLKAMATFAYRFGWRVEEICNLEWSRVDLEYGIVRVDPGDTKNGEGRTVYLDSELKAMFDELWKKRKEAKKLLPHVFLNRSGTGRIRDFRKAWDNACADARIGKKFFHDFRRTAVRNMVRAGIPERVAMIISGHKTREIFDRYNIVNDADLRFATREMEKYMENSTGTISGTIHTLSTKKRGLAVSANPLIL